MAKKYTSIPVNSMADEFGEGISIERLAFVDLFTADKAIANTFDAGNAAHRHDGHSFFLLENGTVSIEIDFQKYTIHSSTVIYVHPDQVHRTIASENVLISALSITTENLNPDYLKLLEGITPAKPLVLNQETASIISEAVSLCIKLSKRKTGKLHHSCLKDSCNALVALIASHYLEHSQSTDKLSRFETVTKAFRELVERNYTIAKRPAAYAQKLNLSTPYLNECVKNTTGYSVSHHIQQRIILEAKRLLSYSDKAVKEIAAELGYDDYPYFSRLFTNVTGMTALAFRKKNRD